MKWIKIVCTFLCVFLLLLLIDRETAHSISSSTEANLSKIDQVIFPHDQVVDVYIDIEEDVYNLMTDNAMAEEYVMADITYNGYSFSNIGIRPKGNSSLKSVANSNSDRFSFKVDLDYYIDDQNFYGITKLNLNNSFSDPTMMAEYLGYEMLAELDADASRTTYVALYINNEYKGLYLSVEHVDEAFLIEHYGNANGELYKPDMGIGSDLEYISDNGLDYTGLFPENFSSYDNGAVTKLIKSIEEGYDLESIFNVDSFLKYLAMSTITVHMDSYQSGMFHNYYLYNNNGVFEWVTWDLNMIFNGFPMSGLSDEEATKFLIDEPVIGAMENYPLLEAIFKNEEYVTRYHEYMEMLIDGYLSEDNFTEKVTTTYEMIKPYVEIDPTSFYTYDQFEESLFQDTSQSLSLLSFVSQRSENIRQQLQGIIPSDNNGQGNEGTKGRGMPDGIGMRPPSQEGKENQGNGMDRMKDGLPSNIIIEDLPEELREYFENGEIPPKDIILKYLDELPEELVTMIESSINMEGQGQQTNSKGAKDKVQKDNIGDFSGMKEPRQQGFEEGLPVEEAQQVNIQSLLINIGLLVIMLLGMLGFTYYLKKK